MKINMKKIKLDPVHALVVAEMNRIIDLFSDEEIIEECGEEFCEPYIFACNTMLYFYKNMYEQKGIKHD